MVCQLSGRDTITLVMPPSHNTSCNCHQFGPVPHVVGYNAALCIEDPEAYTRLDLPLADRRDVIPFGDNPYPTLDEVNISFSSFYLCC